MTHDTTRARSALPTESRRQHIGLWVLQGLIAITFIAQGLSKIGGAERAVTMFDDIGAGSWFRYLIGTLELAGAIGVLIPALCGLAALGLVGLMIGAVGTELFVLHGNPAPPLVLLVLVAVLAWGRRHRTAALAQRVRPVRP
jgi:putative oxidoreductase